MALFGDGVADRRGIGYPKIDLERLVALLAEFADPRGDGFGRHENGAACSHSAGVGDGNGKRGRTCSRHGREQDGETDSE